MKTAPISVAVRLLTLVALVVLAAARPAAAQGTDSVYAASDLSAPPKFASPGTVGRQIQRSYPETLKSAGVTGSVQLEFIVDAKGKVEPTSVTVVAASVPALGEAAKSVVPAIEFVPGRVNGNAVRTRVLLPIAYKTN